MINVVQVEMKIFQLRLGRCFEQELANCVMCELNDFVFFVNDHEVLAPTSNLVDIVAVLIWH